MKNEVLSGAVLRSYEDGKHTSTELILELLSLEDVQLIGATLNELPQTVRDHLERFVVHEYRPRMKVFGGPRPKPATVRFVKNWLLSRNAIKKAI